MARYTQTVSNTYATRESVRVSVTSEKTDHALFFLFCLLFLTLKGHKIMRRYSSHNFLRMSRRWIIERLLCVYIYVYIYIYIHICVCVCVQYTVPAKIFIEKNLNRFFAQTLDSISLYAFWDRITCVLCTTIDWLKMKN